MPSSLFNLSTEEFYALGQENEEEQPQEQEDSEGTILGDIVAAPFRGFEGAVRGGLGLLGIDSEERLLGRSSTFVGGAIEGVVQFGVGFIPGLKVANLASKATGVLAGAGKAAQYGRLAVAGAVADFAVFDGHEAKLSDLIEQNPTLANPVTDFLASDPADSQAEGRFKNALEGLLIGGAGDLLFYGVKSLRAARAARAAGKSPEEVAQAAQKAVKVSEVADAAIRAEGLETTAEGGKKFKGAFPASLDDIPDLAADVDYTLGYAKANKLDLGVSPRRGPAEVLDRLEIQEDYLNTAFLGDERSQAAALQMNHALIEEVRAKGLIGGQNAQEVADGALQRIRSYTGQSEESILGAISKESEDLLSDAVGLAERLKAMEIHYREVNKGLVNQFKRIYDTGASTRDKARAYVLLQRASQAHAHIQGVRSKLGSTFRSLRDEAPDLATTDPSLARELRKVEADDIRQVLDEAGGERALNLELERVRKAFDEYDINGVGTALEPRRKRFLNATVEYWMNSILSGPTTHAVNTLGNTITTLYLPMEQLVGGITTRNQAARLDAVDQLVGMWKGVEESFTYARQVFKDGDNILDPRSRIDDRTRAQRNAITAANAGLEEGSEYAGLIDGLGTLVRTPGRALAASDEFFKQINFRGRARASLMRAGREKGLGGDELGRYVAEELDRIIKDGSVKTTSDVYKQGEKLAVEAGLQSERDIQKFVKKHLQSYLDNGGRERFQIIQRGLDGAEEATFTTALRDGSLPKGLQNLVSAHPLLRFMLPFVRTPTNILSFAGQRSVGAVWDSGRLLAETLQNGPVKGKNLTGAKNRLLRELSSEDPVIRSQAVGRANMAFGWMGMAGTAALAGKITGRGPKDPEARQLLEASGWLPYSFKVPGTDTWISYQRLDPFASIIGTMADAVEFGRYADESDQNQLMQFVTGAFYGLTQNFTNKSYVQGIERTIKLLTSDDSTFEREVTRFMASFEPNLLAQAARTFDPYKREMGTLGETLAARIPLYSNTQMPVRDILGNPVERVQALGGGTIPVLNSILPVAARSVKDNVIYKELVALQHPFQPPGKTQHGIDLTTITKKNRTAYDRYQELVGEVSLRGRKLENELRKLIKSRAYQRMPVESTDDFDSPRIGEIRKVMRRYRSKAWSQLLKEYPELKSQVRLYEQTQANRRRGILDL